MFRTVKLLLDISKTIAPHGKIITGPPVAESAMLYAEINLQDLIKARHLFDVAGHSSRPNVLQLRINPAEPH